MRKVQRQTGMINLNNLAKDTKEVLLTISAIDELKDFVFVGGSALAVYLNHRLSEDIDLFTWKPVIEKGKLYESLNEKYPQGFKVIKMTEKQMDVVISGVKVTFFAEKQKELRKCKTFINYIKIAPIELLTSMKLHTLFLRAKFRDYYDLYVINREIFSIEKMYDIVSKYMPGINKKLFQISLIYVDDIARDNILHLKPKYKISIKKIQQHFQKEVFKFLNK